MGKDLDIIGESFDVAWLVGSRVGTMTNSEAEVSIAEPFAVAGTSKDGCDLREPIIPRRGVGILANWDVKSAATELGKRLGQGGEGCNRKGGT